MATKYEKKLIRRCKLQHEIDLLLGKKSELEIMLKSIDSLFDFVQGIKQAANISNTQLSQKAKDGLQYLQEINQLIQNIKELKRIADIDYDAIDATIDDDTDYERNS